LKIPFLSQLASYDVAINTLLSVYPFPRRTLTLCPQLCMGIQPGTCLPARSAEALPATLCGYFTQAIYRNRPIGGSPTPTLRHTKRYRMGTYMKLSMLNAGQNAEPTVHQGPAKPPDIQHYARPSDPISTTMPGQATQSSPLSPAKRPNLPRTCFRGGSTASTFPGCSRATHSFPRRLNCQHHRGIT